MDLTQNTLVAQLLQMEALAASMRRELGLSADTAGCGYTLGQVWDAYWQAEGRRVPTDTSGNVASVLGWVETEGGPALRDVPMSLLRRATIERWRDWRLQQPGRRKGTTISSGTVSTELHTLKRAILWAVDEGMITVNPLAKLKPGAFKRRQGNVRGEEVAAICKHLPLWAQTATLLMAWSGLRIETCLQLHWADINFETGAITPSKKQSRTKRHGNPTMFGPDAEALAAFRPADALPTDWVFPSPGKGGHWYKRPRRQYSGGHFRFLWRKACIAAGVTTDDGPAVPHHLRHGYKITAEEVMGLTLSMIADSMGHSGTSMTMSYGKIDRRTREDAFERARERVARMAEMAVRKGPRGLVGSVGERESGTSGA